MSRGGKARTRCRLRAFRDRAARDERAPAGGAARSDRELRPEPGEAELAASSPKQSAGALHREARRLKQSDPDLSAKSRDEGFDRGRKSQASARGEVDGHGDLPDFVFAEDGGDCTFALTSSGARASRRSRPPPCRLPRPAACRRIRHYRSDQLLFVGFDNTTFRVGSGHLFRSKRAATSICVAGDRPPAFSLPDH